MADQAARASPSADTTDAWSRFHLRWSRLAPPLRASPGSAGLVREQIDSHDAHVLLLGVTPELADLGRQLTGADWSPEMIGTIWPGDTDRRQSLLCDWRTLPEPATPYTAVIGDGSLATQSWPHGYRDVLRAVARAITPDAPLVIRCYLRPEKPESLGAVRDDTLAGNAGNFHALKWRIAMAVLGDGDNPDIPVSEILSAFNTTFPDREALAAATGWDRVLIDDIDAYAGIDAVYSFPSRRQLAGLFAQEHWRSRYVETSDYPLAERCPLVVATRLQ